MTHLVCVHAAIMPVVLFCKPLEPLTIFQDYVKVNGFFIATGVAFVRHINSEPHNFQVKFSHPSELTFDRHQEVILIDLNCGNRSISFPLISRQMFNLYKIIVFDSSVQSVRIT